MVGRCAVGLNLTVYTKHIAALRLHRRHTSTLAMDHTDDHQRIQFVDPLTHYHPLRSPCYVACRVTMHRCTCASLASHWRRCLLQRLHGGCLLQASVCMHQLARASFQWPCCARSLVHRTRNSPHGPACCRDALCTRCLLSYAFATPDAFSRVCMHSTITCACTQPSHGRRSHRSTAVMLLGD
jgi:hypothetical protein